MRKTDIGLQLSRAFMQKYHYESLPPYIIAMWCGCSRQNIDQIEKRALLKIRRKLNIPLSGTVR
jgi:DNA-directed RNA polymerase specialized sigma subunit